MQRNAPPLYPRNDPSTVLRAGSFDYAQGMLLRRHFDKLNVTAQGSTFAKASVDLPSFAEALVDLPSFAKASVDMRVVQEKTIAFWEAMVFGVLGLLGSTLFRHFILGCV